MPDYQVRFKVQNETLDSKLKEDSVYGELQIPISDCIYSKNIN